MDNPDGVVIRAWSCPISWHRYVKWDGADAYCIEPGCDRSSLESHATPTPRADQAAMPVPRGVVTIQLPCAE